MDLKTTSRATAAGAALITSAGLAIVLYGIITENLERTVGGAIFTMTALTLIALVLIRRWVTNTTAERQRLSDATREKDTERMRYLAAQAALEVERGRLRRDARTEREHLTARLAAERAAMSAQFEDQRAELVCKTMETTVQLYRDGHFDPGAPAPYAQVISLPNLTHQRADAAQPRGRGVTRG
ncbi:hypothetical protein GTX53_24145 [Streptomyces sp. SID5594]|uniref:hypothetical protein n=1 Tax=unclassified Streptomyces TaxID=2593676 RepID=UPI0003666A1D|nr:MULTISPECIES: hypothetical protein [unclassified Streptomyces]MZF56883.1 hypothetical protein [Streptomyces sp. SID5594]